MNTLRFRKGTIIGIYSNDGDRTDHVLDSELVLTQDQYTTAPCGNGGCSCMVVDFKLGGVLEASADLKDAEKTN